MTWSNEAIIAQNHDPRWFIEPHLNQLKNRTVYMNMSSCVSKRQTLRPIYTSSRLVARQDATWHRCIMIGQQWRHDQSARYFVCRATRRDEVWTRPEGQCMQVAIMHKNGQTALQEPKFMLKGEIESTHLLLSSPQHDVWFWWSGLIPWIRSPIQSAWTLIFEAIRSKAEGKLWLCFAYRDTEVSSPFLTVQED